MEDIFKKIHTEITSDGYSCKYIKLSSYEELKKQYEAFEVEYIKLLRRLTSYSPNQAGSEIYAKKLSDLVENSLEWFEIIIDLKLEGKNDISDSK